MRLTENDTAMFGQHPLLDHLDIVLCKHCKAAIKESAFLYHMGMPR